VHQVTFVLSTQFINYTVKFYTKLAVVVIWITTTGIQ